MSRAPAISAMDKKYFRMIYEFQANEHDRLTHEGLKTIFSQVDFKPTDAEEKEYEQMFAKKNDISFGDFLNIFSLKGNKNFK